MEQNSTESETFEFPEEVSEYVRQNRQSTNTQLFSFLTLLNAYIPESYLLMSECLKILGPPDPIHGGPPFEERMKPFTNFISVSTSNPGHVCMIHQEAAQTAVKLLADLRISRSSTVKNLMTLCGHQAQPHIIQFIKDLLTKRKLRERVKNKFSELIHDILRQENFFKAVDVLKSASGKFRYNPYFPQTIARLYHMEYVKRNLDVKTRITYSRTAEEWAEKAIERAPNNSYVADTLGQIYKSRLRQVMQQRDILNMTRKSFEAFKDVERKAEREEGPEMDNTAGTESITDSFNNRGHFGFIQVAKIAFEKLMGIHPQETCNFRKSLEREVEAKFDFFEWYLTYSKLDIATLEPHFFWKDIVLCYEYYTTNTASGSISFPGLLDYLNRGLFMSKGRRAGFEEAEETVSDLETIRDSLKTTYEANVDDVKAAERYTLSNIILSNKMHDSPLVTPVRELQTIIHRFLGAEGSRSPEFYLLVLLLFWPEEELQTLQEEDDEEVEQQATEDDGSEDTTWEDEDSDEEQETRGETAQLSVELMSDLDLREQVTFMRNVFGGAQYAKYLRGRYLLPLFFLGKGSGLSKWIHKSKLDAILEGMVHAEERVTKERQISEMWINGEVWQVPEIQDILLPVKVELRHPHMAEEHDEQEVLVCVGGTNIMATTEAQPEGMSSPVRFYLGFTIKGPVVFPHNSGQ